MLICPECANEWTSTPDLDTGENPIRDSVGNILADGDTVTVIKTLEVKGSTTGIKAGTKVRNIRLVKGIGDHDIDCGSQLRRRVVLGTALAADQRGMVSYCEPLGRRPARLTRTWTVFASAIAVGGCV